MMLPKVGCSTGLSPRVHLLQGHTGSRKRTVNWANFITLSRVPGVLLLVWLLSLQNQIALYVAFVLAFAIALSDLLDGWVARATGSAYTSKLGSVLDSMTDDFTTLTAFLPLMIMGMLPIWFVVLSMLLRVLLASTRLAAALYGRNYPGPRLSTKAVGGIQYSGIVILIGLVALEGSVPAELADRVEAITVTSMALVTGAAVCDYGFANRRILRLYLRKFGNDE